MNQRSDYIAVFDSGVGGISVLRQLLRIMPRERYLYFGDSANAPYGVRSQEEVKALTLAAAEKLVSRGIKALVVACNTATAAAITALRQRYPQLIVIGIEPALKVAADSYPHGQVGVMATPVTLASEKFKAQLARFSECCHTVLLPVPGLVELIEAGKHDSPECEQLLRPLLESYAGKLDALILGCTHYPFAKRWICRILGPETAILDGGEGTAAHTRRMLQQADLLYDGPGELVLENSLGDARILALSKKLAGLEQEVHHG